VGVAGHGEQARAAAPTGAEGAGTRPWPGVGDFDDLVRRYRRELHVYCYRMLGSFDEAEDHVQEVLLRAWRSRELPGPFEPAYLAVPGRHQRLPGHAAPRRPPGRAPATQRTGRLGAIDRQDAVGAAVPGRAAGPGGRRPARPGSGGGKPGNDLACLPGDDPAPAPTPAGRIDPARRGQLSAAKVAELLDTSVPAVNGALQRARATLRHQWPDGRLGWAPAAEPDPGQRRLLQRFIAAHEQADPEALIALLHHDIRLAISPQVGEWNGQHEVGDALRDGMTSLGQWRLLPITANGQPGAAGYLRRPGETAFVPFVLTVLRLEHDRLIDIAAFEQPSMFTAFGLPTSL
jgi:RNA polymerase sigma-70 factor, ECF subfamily